MADGWLEHVSRELGIDPDVPVEALLDAAKVVAHSVERKATPLTTYLIGVAARNGENPAELCKRVAVLAREWKASS